ncbi:MAG: tetratricopeptide repeat protein [Bdellovibrionaceae bacterium]|nr:tetratricopeptide repeat protein [Pseudobdellovibrionaceae bacterium]
MTFTRRATLILGPALLLAAGCATSPSEPSGHGTYFDGAFNDHNRAPASMSPPTVQVQGDHTTIDPVHMRTQADYNYSMGEAYSLDGQVQKAIESFKMTLVYDPESAAVRLRLATEYLKAGLISEALEQGIEAVKADPKNIEGHLLLGGLYSSMKSYDKAVAEYETILKLKPDQPEAPLYLGAVLSEQKKYDKAVKAFETLLKNPDYATPHLAWYYIGRVRLEQKEDKSLKSAESAFKQALKLKPTHVDSVLALSALETRRGKEEAGIQVLAKYQKEQGPNTRIAEILAQVYVEKGRYDEAYEQLEHLEQYGEDPLSAKLRIALIFIEKKIFDQATRKLEEIIEEAPDSDKVRFYLAAVYEETGKDADAITHFRKIPADSTYFQEAVVHASYLLRGQGKLAEAVKVIEGGLSKKKDAPQIYAMHASLLDEMGEHKKALVSLSEGIAKFPDNAQLRFYSGTIHDRLGDKKKTVEDMKKVIELDPNHVQGLNYLAFTWAEEGTNLADAEKLARRAAELDPKDGYILDTLGWILYKQGKTMDAIRLLEAAFRAQPTVGVIAEHLGDAYLRNAMADRALEMYNKALQLETDSRKIEEIKSKITAVDRPKLPDQVRTPSSLND